MSAFGEILKCKLGGSGLKLQFSLRLLKKSARKAWTFLAYNTTHNVQEKQRTGTLGL